MSEAQEAYYEQNCASAAHDLPDQVIPPAAGSQLPVKVEHSAPAVINQPEPPAKAQITAAQAKIEAIADLTKSAYAKASELALTPDEIAKLQSDFPDEAFKPGAAGKENLIYIEHAFLRDRLNHVFGPGQWAVIPRNRWTEKFQYFDKATRTQQEAATVYVEAMLLVRGCFVAEAIGDMAYYPANRTTNFGDAVEGAKTAALRRCCKELGVGLQAWKKDWCEGWWARKRAPRASQSVSRPDAAPTGQSAPKTAPEAHSDAKPAILAPPVPTEEQKRKLVEKLEPGRAIATEFFRAVSALMPNEELEDLPIDYVPVSLSQFNALQAALVRFEAGDPAEMAFRNAEPPIAKGKPATTAASSELPLEGRDDPDSPNAEWRSFPMPRGDHAGIPLAELDRKYLFGLWANYTVETEYKGKPKSPDAIARDEQFRAMLDKAGAHYKFKKK